MTMGAEATEVIEHAAFGVRVELPVAMVTPSLRRLFAEGRYEAPEFAAALQVLQDERSHVVLELGGGLGVVSAALRRHAVRAYHVVEANAALLPIIERTHALNDARGITLHHGAATSDPRMVANGVATFHVAEAFQASSVRMPAAMPSRPVRVPVLALADLIEDHAPDVLIADVEGGEVALFDALTDAGSLRAVVLELHPKVIRMAGTKAVFVALTRLGFVYDADLSSGRVVGFRRLPTSAPR